MLRRTLRKVASTNRYTDGSGRKLDGSSLPRDLYVQKISNRAYPQETEHWQVAVAGSPSPFKGNVMISGGGVVGAAAAAMFSLRGWHVTVVEQKPSPAERMEATAEVEAAAQRHSAEGEEEGGGVKMPMADTYDEIDCALLTRRGLDIFAAAGVPLEHLRHFGCKVEGVMDHPSGYNSLLSKGLTEEHRFAVNMLALDMARLREHLDAHLTRLPTGNCRVFYNHQVVAAYPERKKVVVKSLEEIAEERERSRAAAEAAPPSASTSATTTDSSAVPNPSTPAPAQTTFASSSPSSSSALATTGPSAVATVPPIDSASYEGLHYDLLIDAEGAGSKLRDMLNVEGFAADKIYGIKWFALDEVVEVTTRRRKDSINGKGGRRPNREEDNGEYIRNPNFGKEPGGRTTTFATADSMLEEDEYGKVTQREKLRILNKEKEKQKMAVRGGRRRGYEEEEGLDDEELRKGRNETEQASAEGKEEEEAVDQRFFFLEKSHIHRWTYPCPKGTPNTAVCQAFPRMRSCVSTATSEEEVTTGEERDGQGTATTAATTTATYIVTRRKYRNSYSVMAYFPMSVLRALSDEEFLQTYLSDLAFERRGFYRPSAADEFGTEGGKVNDGLGAYREAKRNNKNKESGCGAEGEDEEGEQRISYFELETPSRPAAASVARFSTRGKIIPYPTVYCEDLFNGIGLPSAVVVGDAAHCANPFLMQNLSAALEDASILLNQLDAISRHFYDSVKQYSRERGVAGDSLRIITERSLYYNRAKHVNPLLRLRNNYTKLMYRLMPRYYNEFFSTNMNHLYPRSVEWMLNGRGYTSYEKTEMTQTKLQRWIYFGRNYT